jgi:hypothetical protein
VAPRIEQHVGERIAHAPRRGEHLVVVAVGEHLAGAPATDRPIHGKREQPGEPLRPAPEPDGSIRLDDQMRMIVLDRVVDEPEARARARPTKRSLHFANHLARAQRRNLAPHLQRDEAGTDLSERVRAPTAFA